MLNSLRDGQLNYGTTNCPSAHVSPHNVVAPIHQNAILPNESSTPVVYPWNSNSRLDHLYDFHSRYYNLDFPSPYPPATNQYVPSNMYGQNIPQCCQPCCRLRSQNIPKTSPQMLYNPIQPVQQLNRSYKSKKTLKTSCSEQFLPYIPNDLPVKYDTQNCYQQKYNSSYLNNTNYCPPANNLWIPPAPNPTWSTERLRPVSHNTGVVSHDFSRNKNYPRLPNYQSNPHPNPTSATHHRPYDYIPPIPDVNDYRPPVYHQNGLKNHSSNYLSHEQISKLPISSQNNQIPSSSFQQYYNVPPASYSDIPRSSESFKSPQNSATNPSKSNLNVREFLANWDEGEEETNEKSSESNAPIVILDCMTVEGDALTKIQEKLNVVSYENLEKVLKENQNPVVINAESNEIDFTQNKAKSPPKPSFEPLDYTKRETGIIKPFITEKKPEINSHTEKSYSVNFDGMVAWYGKKNTDISSTDLIERLADRIFNLSKSQESDGVSFGTAAYTGQITQTNRSFVSSAKDSSKYLPSHQIFDLHHRSEKIIEPSVIYKPNNSNDYNNDSIPRTHSFDSDENNKASAIKSNNTNSSCIVENITKKCLNLSNEQTIPWNIDHGSQEQHLNTSLYDHSVIIKPLDFSSLTDETKSNPFVFDKNTSSGNKPNDHGISDQYNKVMNESNNYSSPSSNNQHSIQQIDSSNRNFPVIVSPNIHKQEYNGLHESVIQRTGCSDKNKHDNKVPLQTDFESMNWNLSNDFDKIMKNSHLPIMEPSCIYDKNNYNILDNMNSNKNVSNQWKDNIPCVDLTVSSKSNPNQDSFFDGWNFIESYENHSSKRTINVPANNNQVPHSSLYPNLISSIQKSKNQNDHVIEKFENETLGNVKNIPFPKPNDISSNNLRSRDVFNLNNRIPDFSDGFELPIINEPHEYIQFKKLSNDNEHRTDGSIFEHLTEPKCYRPMNETSINTKKDQIKSDSVSLPSFKEKEPLAPMPVPPKLNIVKPIIRDPSQIYTVIKQKVKYDNNSCIDSDNTVSNKTGHNLRVNQTNVFNGTDLKSKFNNNVQPNQFDVWSEKFVLKDNLNDSSSAVVQCDVEITQFKSTSENRNTLMPKSNISEHFQDKNTKLLENLNCNLTVVDKININENDKINSNDFLNCLENTKTDDQKYQDTLDEFETSFGFDMHCNNESHKSFQEDIVDKCLEESIKDQIGEHNVNTSNLTNTSNNNNKSSNNIQSPFHCNFQSDYLIKNFDENKNKAVGLDEKQIINHEKSSTVVFSYPNEMEHDFGLQDGKNIHKNENKSDKNLDFNILNHASQDIKQNKNEAEENNSNLLKDSSEAKHCSTNISNTSKHCFNYLTMESRNFEFDDSKKSIFESTNSKETSELDNSTDTSDIFKKDHCSSSNIDKLSNVKTLTTVNDGFKLNITDSNIFGGNLNTQHRKCMTETHDNKSTLEPSFHYENVESIKNKSNNEHTIFELENNNSSFYQTNNFKQIHEFDFGINYSNSNNYKSSITNENKNETQYSYDINDEKEKITKKETNLNNSLFTQKEHIISECPSLDCKNDAMHGTKTQNISNKNKMNNNEEKFKRETYTDFNMKNKTIEEHIHDNLNIRDNLSNNNNAEVENIFRNLYDNLSTLNTEKNNSILSKNICQNDDNSCDASESLKKIEDHNSISKKSEVTDVNLAGTKLGEQLDEPNKTFNESNNVLLEKFVNNRSSHSMVDSLKKKELLKEEKPQELKSVEQNTWDSFKYTTNTNKNFSDVPNKTTVRGNHVLLEEQHKIIDQSEVESINHKNTQTKNTTVDAVQNDATKKIFENIKTDLLNAVQNMDETDSKKNRQNNSPQLNSLNHDLQNPTKMVLIDGIINTKSSSLNDTESLLEHHTNNDLEVKGLNISESNSLKSDQKHFNEIVTVQDTTSVESNPLNNFDLTYRQHSDDIFKIIDLSKSGPSSFNSLNDVEFVQNSNVTIEVEDTPKSPPILQKSAEFTSRKHFNDIDEVEESTSFRSNSANNNAFICHQNKNDMFEVENLPKSEPIVLDVEVTRQEHSNKINEMDNSISIESSSLDDVEITCKLHSNETVEIGDKHIFSSLNYTESTRRQNSNELVGIDDSNSNSCNSFDDIESNCEQHADEMLEVEDSSKCKANSLNNTEFTREQHLNDIGDLTSSSSNEFSNIELTSQQHSNDMCDTQDSLESRPSLLNDVIVTVQKHSNEMVEVVDSTNFESNLLNYVELTCKQNSNEMVEVKDFSKPGPSLLNHPELTDQLHSNQMVEVDNLTNIESSLLNDVELTCKQNSNEMVEVKDFSKSGSSSLNHSELTDQLHFNEIIDVHDSNNSGSLDDVKSTFRQNFDEIVVDLEVSSKYKKKSLNNIEFNNEEHSKEPDNFDGLINPESNLLDDDELTYQKHPDNILDVEDSPDSETSSLNDVEVICQHHSNKIVDIDNLSESEFSSFNHTKLTHQKHSNEISQVDELTYSELNSLNNVGLLKHQYSHNKLVDYSSSCSSLDDAELTSQQNLYQLDDFEDSYEFGSRTLNNNELTCQKHSNDIVEDDESTTFSSKILENVEVTRQQSFNETVEVDNPSKSVSTLFYHTESKDQHSNKFGKIDEPTFSKSNSLNDVGLSKHQCSSYKLVDNSTSVKTSESDENDSDFKSHDDSSLENKDSNSVIGNIKLPRVKFILKCQTKIMIKKNVFDEDSNTVPSKKLNMVNDKKVFEDHIFKKRFNLYKPRLCKKETGDELKKIIRDIVEKTCLTSPEHITHAIECLGFNDNEENNDRVVTDSVLTFTNEKQCDQTSKIVKDEKPKCIEDEEISRNTTIILDECTPSVDNVHIEEQPSEQNVREEYWDKLLEKEYKTEFHKTISKLTKNRINIRDKFNVRLLARRTNETKRKKRQRRRKLRQTNNTTNFVVDNNGFASKLAVDHIEVPTAVLQWSATAAKTTSAKCKIKVQLPWGRIFNLGNRLDANSYTRLELGPAKVEVRMSETPGEWKLSACRSTTSSKSVVNVKRLVLQRAETIGDPSKELSDSGCSTVDSVSTISGNSGYSDGSSGSSGNSGTSDNDSLTDSSRKLPKIVIKRNGLNNNYTSYVSSGGCSDDNINDSSPQLMVRLIRDSRLDAMATSGITTLHLKHFIPESDTHDAKRVRYT